MTTSRKKGEIPRCPTCGNRMEKSYFYWYCPVEHSIEDAELWYQASELGFRVATKLGLSEEAGDFIAEEIERWFKQALYGRDEDDREQART